MDAEELRRRLFDEPGPEIEREDAWSEPKGFLIGGMALPSRTELARQYFDAANALVEAILRLEWEDYRLANPALFFSALAGTHAEGDRRQSGRGTRHRRTRS